MQTVTEKEVNAGLTQASDAAFINAFTADGTPIKISKADLASVVAEIVSPFIFHDGINQSVTKIGDLPTGIFYDGSAARYSDIPQGVSGYCVIVSCLYGTSRGIQLLCVYSGSIYIRARNNEGWFAWQKV